MDWNCTWCKRDIRRAGINERSKAWRNVAISHNGDGRWIVGNVSYADDRYGDSTGGIWCCAQCDEQITLEQQTAIENAFVVNALGKATT